MSFRKCEDSSEAIALESSLSLYLKPASKIKINVQLPKLKTPGQSISSYHVMEKIKSTILPDEFIYLKSLKITPTVIKLEGELETRSACERALSRLKSNATLKLSGFLDWLHIRAAHAPPSGPMRHDWEAFYRDAKGVNEMKPGERPDTIHFQEMPTQWFAENSKSKKPSERLLGKAFTSFGKIRRLEILDHSGTEENIIGKSMLLNSDKVFEAYIQYEEYVEFSIAMDALRGKKLLYKDPDGKVFSADIKVDFDKTNYLSDKCIRQREYESRKAKLSTLSEPDGKVIEISTEKKFNLPGEEVSTIPATQDTAKVEINSTEDKSHTKKEQSSTIKKEQSSTTKKEQNSTPEDKSHSKKSTQMSAKEEKRFDHKQAKDEARFLIKELFQRAEKSEKKKEAERVKLEVAQKEKSSHSTSKKKSFSEKEFSHEGTKRKYRDVDHGGKKKCRVEPITKRKEKKPVEENFKDDQNRNTKTNTVHIDENERRKILLEQERILKNRLLKNLKAREEVKIQKMRENLTKRLIESGVLKNILSRKNDKILLRR